jgi:hypothetical protein
MFVQKVWGNLKFIISNNSVDSDPFQFTIGDGQLIPDFE